jgi:hypothetical protein
MDSDTDKICIFRRKSFGQGRSHTDYIDEDNSIEHVTLVIAEYKRLIASWITYNPKALLAGLAIEEQMLQDLINAQNDLNNNAKSARKKK